MFINDVHEEYMWNKLNEILSDMDYSEIVSVWNEYCEQNNYYDDRIEYMENLNDYFYGCTAMEIIDKVEDEDFSTRDDYFRTTMYGVESFSDPFDYVEIDDLTDYIIEHEETFYSSELEDFWVEVEEQNERYEELVEDKASVLTVLYGDYFVNVVLNGRKVKSVKTKVAN